MNWRREVFRSGHEAIIREADCIGWGDCERVGRFGAIRRLDSGQASPKYVVDPVACEGCGVCVRFCPEEAIDVSKWNLDPSMTERIEHTARARGAAVANRVRYDTAVTSAQIRAQAVVECESEIGNDVRDLWRGVADIGDKHGIRL